MKTIEETIAYLESEIAKHIETSNIYAQKMRESIDDEEFTSFDNLRLIHILIKLNLEKVLKFLKSDL